MRYQSLFFLAVTATSAVAQSHSGPLPDGRRLHPARDSLDVYIVSVGEQRRTGVVIDQLDTVRVGGETMLRRIYRTNDALLGTGVDTLVDALAGLQPRSVRTYSDRITERLDWTERRVVGVVEEPDKPSRSVDSPVPMGWYSAASFDLIVRASPLAEGYEISVPAFSGRDGSRVLTAKVTGSESVPGHGETWRVDADFAGLPVTLWISKTSRRLVREVMHVAPGTEIVFIAPAPGSSA